MKPKTEIHPRKEFTDQYTEGINCNFSTDFRHILVVPKIYVFYVYITNRS